MSEQALLNTLQALEAELHHPGVRCSRQRLEALLHPDFHEVGRSGRAYDRPTIVAYLLSEASGVTSAAIVAGDYALQRLAEGTALLTYRSAHRGPDGRLSLAARRSSIWQHSAAGWQLIYHQGTPEAEGAEPLV